MHKSVLAVMLAAVAGAASAAATAPAQYSVEVLVFRYTGPDAARGEIWPPSVPAPATGKALYPPAVAPDQPFAALPSPSAAMSAANRRIANTAGYAVVLELGWRQPQAAPSQAVAVSLAPPMASAPAAETGGPLTASVDGTVTVVKANRKPNVALDLRLCEPPPPNLELQLPPAADTSLGAAAQTLTAPAAITFDGPGETGNMQCFALSQRRFVVAGQLEYFDNPAFGVLVLVDEVKSPG